MAKSRKNEAASQADVPDSSNPIETAPVAESEPARKPKRTKAKPVTRTLAEIFEGYLKALDERGSSSGTIASYRMELDLAGKALGTDTSVSTLTDTQVGGYFESDPVTRKRNGKRKSPLSIDKTRRVLRQALVWAGHADLVPTEVTP